MNLFERLNRRHPIVAAPMAGGATTPALVAAVGEAGALGFIGAAYNTPEQILEQAGAIRALTDQPFGINLFAPQTTPAVPNTGPDMLDRIAPFFAELGLCAPAIPERTGPAFEAQLDAVLQTDAAVFSFTFGIPPDAALDRLRARGMLVFGTATTVEEARLLEGAGVDAVVAQGSEAGAHRGTFAGAFDSSMVGTMALVPQIVDAVAIPVLASGGIMDGRGIAAALALGACGAQLGTAFLTSDEAGIPPVHKQAILAASEDGTRITRAFSGRAARGIVNRFMAEMEDPSNPAPIMPYPLQNALTQPLRREAAKQGRAEFLSLWAGQGVRLARAAPVATLVAQWVEEMAAAAARAAGRTAD